MNLYQNYVGRKVKILMTDFKEGNIEKCGVCGIKYHTSEGKNCVCWKCNDCGETFSNYDMLGNKELWLCLYCEDERYQVETKE